MTAAATIAKPGRNEPCYCGSGKKYKQCCLAKDETDAATRRAAAQAAEAAARAEAAQTEEAAPDTGPAKPAPSHAPKHHTHQPWKATTSRGFAPKTRMPRKAGGS